MGCLNAILINGPFISSARAAQCFSRRPELLAKEFLGSTWPRAVIMVPRDEQPWAVLQHLSINGPFIDG